MSFKQKVAEAEKAQAQGGAPANQINKKSGQGKKTDEFKLKGAKLREGMTEEQRAYEGSKQDQVAFVATLANPMVKQSRKIGDHYEDSLKPCGYQLKILEDTTVPVAPLKEDCADELDVVFPATERPVKKGETVNLNIVETAIFISREEYAGRFTGNGVEVFIAPTSSADKADPSPTLRQVGGSVKESMIEVAKAVGKDANGRGGHGEVLPGFEMFAPLFKKKASKRGGNGGASRKGENTKNTAAAFRQLYASKNA